MVNQDKFGGIRDCLFLDNFVKNDRESVFFYVKFVNFDDQ